MYEIELQIGSARLRKYEGPDVSKYFTYQEFSSEVVLRLPIDGKRL